MASPKLTGISPPPEEVVISAILARLRADAAIVANNVTIQAPEGEPASLAVLGGQAKNAPNRADLPLIRLTIGPGAGKWENESQHALKWGLLFDLFAPGCHFGDRFRLLSIFLAAMDWGGIDSTHEIRPEMTIGGAEPVSLGDDDYGQVSRVTIMLAMNHDT